MIEQILIFHATKGTLSGQNRESRLLLGCVTVDIRTSGIVSIVMSSFGVKESGWIELVCS